MSFNIFSQPTPDDIRVGYISTARGFIDNVSKCEANIYAKKNPGATFIFKTRERIRYLNVNEVNALTVADLGGNQENICEGLQLDSECGPPKVYFYGGGGVGVQGNPIIGIDGSVLAVDLVSGGHGYQYAPLTEIKDGCGIGAGVVVRSIVGDVAEELEIFDQQDDFEDYQICIVNEAGFGNRYDVNGNISGSWDPKLYASLSDDPIRREIKEYQDFLQQAPKPWWTTRKEIPLRVTATGKVNTVIHKVTDKTYREFQDAKGPGNLQATIDKGFVWNKFMNRHAVSPVPPSAAPGSDFATELFQIEWEEDFPYDGIYRFRGNGDGAIKELYVDNKKVMSLSSFNEAPSKVKKYIKSGVHQIRIDLKNGGFYKETIAAQSAEAPPGGIFLQEGGSFFYLIGGNDVVKVQFQFDWRDKASSKGYLRQVTLQTEDGGLSFTRSESDETGSITKRGTFKAGKKYRVSFDHNAHSAGFRIVDTGSHPNQKSQRIEFDDDESNGWDLNAKFTALNAQNLSGAKIVKSAKTVTQRSKELFTTTDFISRANKVLFRTNPSNLYADNNFMNSFGITPVNPNTIETRTESFSGSYDIVWRGVNFPDKTVYTFEIMADDFATITISGNRQEPIVIEKPGGPRSSKLVTSHSIKPGKYDITVILEQSNDGPLKVGGQDKNPMAFAMTVVSAIADTYELEKRAWNDNPMGASVAIDAPLPPIPQEPIPKQTGRCPNNPIWTTRYPTAAERWWPVSWSEALGEFGRNREAYWTDFFNRYAISPVPPLGTLNSDAGGVVFTNSWPVDIPYDGFYKFVVQRDNIAKIFVDGRLSFDLKGSGDIIWKHHRNKPKTQSIFLTRGSHTISLELINHKTETFKWIDQKIFRSKEFQGGSNVKGGVTYSGPKLFHYQDERWSKFMNNHGLSAFTPPLDAPNPEINGRKDYIFSGVDFPETDQYEIYVQGDNNCDVFVNSIPVAKSKSYRGVPIVQKANISKGKWDIVVRMENTPDLTDIFYNNPTGFALVIQRKVRVTTGLSKSWVMNPVAISAILIPPPCPRLISGRGTIVDVLIDDPGNGYPRPIPDPGDDPETNYPVSLRIKSIEVEDPGINYNCGVDELVIEPSNGAELSYNCDTFGRIISVDIINPGLGFTKYPDIRMETETGVNATFRPQFEVVRDPIVVDPEKLIQVTDLVGLKQTGYVDGRAYFGAVFYKNSIRYAGFYETPGDLVQVYDTLQESIDAEVTTPPSAIQRQGTDITSNDPRLDIPNTPDDLTEID
jgi:hypothetical protein